MKVQGAILLATLVVCQLVFSGGCFLDATGYSSGGNGGAGGGNTSTGGQDCQSSGNVGGDSASTSNSTAGSTSSSASECATSAGGGGGGGGEGGSTSSSGGGEGGSGGSTSSTGGGGSGGEGGSGPTGCEAGTEATPNDLEGWGNGESAGLLVQEDGSSQFLYDANGGAANSLNYTLSSTDTFPGQLVLTGGNGIHLRLTDGGQDRPQATYLVQGDLVPYEECKGDFYGEECLTIVAKDYRCQNGSAEPDCPALEVVYSSQGSVASYDLNVDGDWLLLVDIQCAP